MYFLAIDTATNSGGVAVSRNSEVIGKLMVKTPLQYSDRIIYYIDFLLEQLSIGIEDVGCYVVAHGPGSFTGLRIGLATTKALCQGRECPGVGVSTLEALAYRFRGAAERVAPMIDARRQQVYGGVYECRDGQVKGVQPVTVLPPAAWLKQLPEEPCLFVGDGAQMYHQTILALRPKDRFLRTDNCILNELCELGYWSYVRGETVRAESIQAHYVRPSDAEMPE